MTKGCNLVARAGPMPRTSWSASKEPNGPYLDRSSTMRLASVGPIPGRASSSASLARSKSTSTRAAGGLLVPPAARLVPGVGAGGAPLRDARLRAGDRPPRVTAESTAAIWAARASRSGTGCCCGRTARTPRTASPSAATAATNSRARRSDGVGTAKDDPRGQRERDRPYARVIKFAACSVSYIPRSTAIATSPTTCSVTAETLSAVSSGVW